MWGFLLDLFFAAGDAMARRKREQEQLRQAQIDASDRALREELKAAEARKVKPN